MISFFGLGKRFSWKNCLFWWALGPEVGGSRSWNVVTCQKMLLNVIGDSRWSRKTNSSVLGLHFWPECTIFLENSLFPKFSCQKSGFRGLNWSQISFKLTIFIFLSPGEDLGSISRTFLPVGTFLVSYFIEKMPFYSFWARKTGLYPKFWGEILAIYHFYT